MTTKTEKTVEDLEPKLSAIIDYCQDTDIQVMIIAYNGKEVYTASHGNANEISKAVSLCDNQHIKDIAKLATIRAMVDEERGVQKGNELDFN
jgi:hypothetical protein